MHTHSISKTHILIHIYQQSGNLDRFFSYKYFFYFLEKVIDVDFILFRLFRLDFELLFFLSQILLRDLMLMLNLSAVVNDVSSANCLRFYRKVALMLIGGL